MKYRRMKDAPKTLIAGLAATILVLGLALTILAIGLGSSSKERESLRFRVNALDGSKDKCVRCHRDVTPGIIEQYGHSSMALAGVTCRDCHETAPDYPGAIAHEGSHILSEPSSARCARCHAQETAQFNQSRHGLPAYVAYAGTKKLSPELLATYENIPEGGYRPEKMRSALFAKEGEEVARFACRSCHDIGRPAPDGSVGDCSKCHLRHEFSLEQARKPETCNACHIGPDHPQWEIYQESYHGIAYMTGGHRWHWEVEPGRLGVKDFPAPTCAICHMSGFGASGTSHDVGDRLAWYLFAPISERRPSWQDNRARMQNVCRECHNERFVNDFYAGADAATERINAWVREGNAVVKPLQEGGLLTAEPFDEPIDFVLFELWHHWGRTAKFGVWMQGPDYTQWHGAYEMLSELAELRQMAKEKLAERDRKRAETKKDGSS